MNDPKATRSRALYDQLHDLLERAGQLLHDAEADLDLRDLRFRLALLRLLLTATRRSNVPARASAALAAVWRAGWTKPDRPSVSTPAAGQKPGKGKGKAKVKA